MTYTVTYRDSQGNVCCKTFDAKSRKNLFAVLKDQGLIPVKVTEGAIKVNDGKFFTKKNNILWGIIFSVITISGIFFVCFNKTPLPEVRHTSSPEAKKVPEKPVTVKPAAIKNPVTNVVIKEKRFWEVDASETNGFTEVQMKKWQKARRPPPSYTNTTSLTEKPPSYAIFQTRCENEIACFLTMTPGETLVGTPHYTPKQKEEFIKALDAPMIFNKEDTVEQQELRRLVEETKIALKRRIAEGEDIGEIFISTREEFQDLARYKNNMANTLSELRKDPDTTIEEIDALIKAANAELEGKGIAPLKLGVITRRMLQQYHKNSDKRKGRK